MLRLVSLLSRARAMILVRRKLRSGDPLRLDIGCGCSARPGFVGIDLSWRADLMLDIRDGLPFPDNSILEIRSDHCFEHLRLPDVVYVLKECHRVLKPGGILDFTVPHIDPYLEAYAAGNSDFLREKISDVPVGQEELYTTGFDRLSWLLSRDGEHRSLFDREAILHKVRIAGFDEASTRNFCPSRDVNQRFSSIYVTAKK